MADDPKRLFQMLLLTTDSMLYECPSGKQAIITALFICNTSSADHTFRLHHVDAGVSSSGANALYYDQPVTGKLTLRDGNIMLRAAQQLRASVSGVGTITITGFGIEIALVE